MCQGVREKKFAFWMHYVMSLAAVLSERAFLGFSQVGRSCWSDTVRGVARTTTGAPLCAYCPLITRWIVWIGAIVFVLVMVLAAAIADESVRKYPSVYTLRIGKLDLHPLTLSLDLENVTLSQYRHTDPPMAHIPKWRTDVQLGGLLTGNVVSAHRIDGPSATVTHAQTKPELTRPRSIAHQRIDGRAGAGHVLRSWRHISNHSVSARSPLSLMIILARCAGRIPSPMG